MQCISAPRIICLDNQFVRSPKTRRARANLRFVPPTQCTNPRKSSNRIDHDWERSIVRHWEALNRRVVNARTYTTIQLMRLSRDSLIAGLYLLLCMTKKIFWSRHSNTLYLSSKYIFRPVILRVVFVNSGRNAIDYSRWCPWHVEPNQMRAALSWK